MVLNKKQIDEKYEIEKSNYSKEETREILQITTQDQIKANEFLELITKGKDFEELANKVFTPPESEVAKAKRIIERQRPGRFAMMTLLSANVLYTNPLGALGAQPQPPAQRCS